VIDATLRYTERHRLPQTRITIHWRRRRRTRHCFSGVRRCSADDTATRQCQGQGPLQHLHPNARDIMEQIAVDVTGASCKQTYGKVVTEMDVDDAPRDSHVVRNKKYNDTAKSHSKGSSATVTFTDEIQPVCSLVSHDDFVQ